MRVFQLTTQQQAEVKVLQDQYKQAQHMHMASYKALLSRLQQISGVQAEAGRKTRLALDETGQNIIAG